MICQSNAEMPLGKPENVPLLKKKKAGDRIRRSKAEMPLGKTVDVFPL